MTHQGDEEEESQRDPFHLSSRRSSRSRDPSDNTKCLQPIEGVHSNEGDLSARGIAHRSREVFVDKVGSSTWILRKALDSHVMSNNRRSLSTKFARAYAYHRLQMYQKALDDYNACLTIEPTWSFALYNRGCALYGMGKKEAAVIDFGKAMKADPKCTLYIESRAIVLKELGNFKEAIVDYALLDALRNEDPNAVSTAAGTVAEGEEQMVLSNTGSHSTTASLMPTTTVSSHASVASITSTASAIPVSRQKRGRRNDKKEKSYQFLLQFLRIPTEKRKPKQISEALGYVKGWSFFEGMEEALVKQYLEVAELQTFDSHRTEPLVSMGNIAESFFLLLNPEVQVEKSIDNETNTTIRLEQGEPLGASPQSGVVSNPTIGPGTPQANEVKKKQSLLEARSGSIIVPGGMTSGAPLCSIRQRTGGSAPSFLSSLPNIPTGEGPFMIEPATIYYRRPVSKDKVTKEEEEEEEEEEEVNEVPPIHCLSIEADMYNEVVNIQAEDLLQERIDFLRSCRLFQYCPSGTLGRLALLAGIKTWSPQETILATGEVVKQLCLIKRGVCQVQKSVCPPHPSSNTTNLSVIRRGSSSTSDGPRRESAWAMDGSWVLDNGWMLTNPRLVNNGARSKTPNAGRSNCTTMTPPATGNTVTGRSSVNGREVEMLELTVATLARGQFFGELSVLQPGQSSQVTIRSMTMVEVLTFEESVLAQFNVQYIPGTMNALQESLLFHNPPQQKLVQLLKEWELWEKEKASVLKQVFPTAAGAKSRKETSSNMKRNFFKNRSSQSRLSTIGEDNGSNSGSSSVVAVGFQRGGQSLQETGTVKPKPLNLPTIKRKAIFN